MDVLHDIWLYQFYFNGATLKGRLRELGIRYYRDESLADVRRAILVCDFSL